MKRLLLLGTVAALALTTTVQAQSVEQREVSRPTVSARHPVNTERTTVAPSTSRNVVRNYRSSGRYYTGGTRYYRGGRYYRGDYDEPVVSVGFGGYYPGYYDYGYGYPYAYGYGYPYNYGYGYTYPSDYYYGDQYPTGYTTTTYRTSSYGDLAYDDNLVAAVQERLKRAGYYLGAIDGVAGPETRSAIMRWEGNHGMAADGRIDETTLRSMGLG